MASKNADSGGRIQTSAGIRREIVALARIHAPFTAA
jgi:hypothetical protein